MNPLQYFEDDFEIDLDDEELFKNYQHSKKQKVEMTSDQLFNLEMFKTYSDTLLKLVKK